MCSSTRDSVYFAIFRSNSSTRANLIETGLHDIRISFYIFICSSRNSNVNLEIRIRVKPCVHRLRETRACHYSAFIWTDISQCQFAGKANAKWYGWYIRACIISQQSLSGTVCLHNWIEIISGICDHMRLWLYLIDTHTLPKRNVRTFVDELRFIQKKRPIVYVP